MNFLFYCHGDDGRLFDAVRSRLDSKHSITVWTKESTLSKGDFDKAIVWLPPDDFFDGLENLTHVFALAAGVDHLLKHPGLPSTIPVIRLRDAGMGVQMAEYALYGTLHAQRKMQEFRIAQNEKRWDHGIYCASAADTRVGVLGAGALGATVAERLSLNGYSVKCWSRNPKDLSVPSVHGSDALPKFLEASDVLICLLPLTSSTQGILNKQLFGQLPDGAFIINPGRGGHLVDNDLLASLDSGKLSGALLDVFHDEPLPEEHPFWQHSRVVITPHVAAKSVPDLSAAQIIESIQSVERGEKPLGWVDRRSGY